MNSEQRGVILGRRKRAQFYGAIYHISNKGIRNIFEDDQDKLFFISILSDVKDLFDFKLLAYCILDDKYHLFIKTHNISISKVMQRVNMLYARYYNSIYKRKGPVFKERYTSSTVKSEANLFNLVKYIHMLPVYENREISIDEYKWSSDVFYRINLESIVDIDYILDIFSLERHDAINRYKELMTTLDGEMEFVKGYYDESLDSLNHKKLNISLDDILKKICQNDGDFDLIKEGSKKSYLIKYKEDYIKESQELGFKIEDIGQNIGISERAVRQYLLKIRGK